MTNVKPGKCTAGPKLRDPVEKPVPMNKRFFERPQDCYSRIVLLPRPYNQALYAAPAVNPKEEERFINGTHT